MLFRSQGITCISKSDVAGKIALNIPVKISTGRLVSTIKPEYRSSYALIRYISLRNASKNVASNIDIKTSGNALKTILERIKEFFYT